MKHNVYLFNLCRLLAFVQARTNIINKQRYSLEKKGHGNAVLGLGLRLELMEMC